MLEWKELSDIAKLNGGALRALKRVTVISDSQIEYPVRDITDG